MDECINGWIYIIYIRSNVWFAFLVNIDIYYKDMSFKYKSFLHLYINGSLQSFLFNWFLFLSSVHIFIPILIMIKSSTSWNSWNKTHKIKKIKWNYQNFFG